VCEFKGTPLAEPPHREAALEPAADSGQMDKRSQSTGFGPRCTQQALFGDMNFRSNGMSEDCLYLNVWTPAKSGNARLPVLVYFRLSAETQ
jgi:para-nitrobenzyl esterase